MSPVHTERAVKLIRALEAAREHLALAEVVSPGDTFTSELILAAEAVLEAIEINAGVVYHGERRGAGKAAQARGGHAGPPEAA